MKVLSIFLAFAAVAVSAEKYHYHNTCDTNGVFACSDDWQSLLQCGYVRGNVLAGASTPLVPAVLSALTTDQTDSSAVL
ncbi:hypothetical protein BCR33DRAFT_717406, partial [Rhizoclosmatium globosum]